MGVVNFVQENGNECKQASTVHSGVLVFGMTIWMALLFPDTLGGVRYKDATDAPEDNYTFPSTDVRRQKILVMP